MTDDIVERLRNGGARCSLGTDFAYPCKPGECCDECDCAREAADEIERLRALITAWADAGQAIGVTIGVTIGGTTDECDAYENACSALRKAVGR